MSSGGGSSEPPSSSQQPAAGQPASGHWLTRWQTVLVAVITAVSAITVAAIGLLGKDGEDSTKPPVITSPVTASAIGDLKAEMRNVQYKLQQDGSRVITVSGVIHGLDPPKGVDDLINIHVFADPIDVETQAGIAAESDARSSRGSLVYMSKTLMVAADGSWQTTIQIDASDKRDVDVYLGVLQGRGAAALPPPESGPVEKEDVVQKSGSLRVTYPG